MAFGRKTNILYLITYWHKLALLLAVILVGITTVGVTLFIIKLSK